MKILMKQINNSELLKNWLKEEMKSAKRELIF
jgi:hypothetical protein